eukprot:g16373.t1
MSFLTGLLFGSGGSSHHGQTSPKSLQSHTPGGTQKFSLYQLQQQYGKLRQCWEEQQQQQGGTFSTTSTPPSSSTSAPPLSSGGRQDQNFQLSEQGKALMVEAIREITEILIWGEKQDSVYFDYFCEKNMLQDFVRCLALPHLPAKVKIQILQTLSILITNVHETTNLYYLFSNNYVNTLIGTQLDWLDEEILAYYISFLKTLTLKLNPETIKFFFNDANALDHTRPAAPAGRAGKQVHKQASFPLYTEAIRFFTHHDQMVQTSVRTMTLAIFKIAARGPSAAQVAPDPALRSFLLRNRNSRLYLIYFACFFRNLLLEMNDLFAMLPLEALDEPEQGAGAAASYKSKIGGLLDKIEDCCGYIRDVFSCEFASLSRVFAANLMQHCFFPGAIVFRGPKYQWQERQQHYSHLDDNRVHSEGRRLFPPMVDDDDSFFFPELGCWILNRLCYEFPEGEVGHDLLVRPLLQVLFRPKLPRALLLLATDGLRRFQGHMLKTVVANANPAPAAAARPTSSTPPEMVPLCSDAAFVNLTLLPFVEERTLGATLLSINKGSDEEEDDHDVLEDATAAQFQTSTPTSERVMRARGTMGTGMEEGGSALDLPGEEGGPNSAGGVYYNSPLAGDRGSVTSVLSSEQGASPGGTIGGVVSVSMAGGDTPMSTVSSNISTTSARSAASSCQADSCEPAFEENFIEYFYRPNDNGSAGGAAARSPFGFGGDLQIGGSSSSSSSTQLEGATLLSCSSVEVEVHNPFRTRFLDLCWNQTAESPFFMGAAVNQMGQQQQTHDSTQTGDSGATLPSRTMDANTATPAKAKSGLRLAASLMRQMQFFAVLNNYTASGTSTRTSPTPSSTSEVIVQEADLIATKVVDALTQTILLPHHEVYHRWREGVLKKLLESSSAELVRQRLMSKAIPSLRKFLNRQATTLATSTPEAEELRGSAADDGRTPGVGAAASTGAKSWARFDADAALDAFTELWPDFVHEIKTKIASGTATAGAQRPLRVQEHHSLPASASVLFAPAEADESKIRVLESSPKIFLQLFLTCFFAQKAPKRTTATPVDDPARTKSRWDDVIEKLNPLNATVEDEKLQAAFAVGRSFELGKKDRIVCTISASGAPTGRRVTRYFVVHPRMFLLVQPDLSKANYAVVTEAAPMRFVDVLARNESKILTLSLFQRVPKRQLVLHFEDKKRCNLVYEQMLRDVMITYGEFYSQILAAAMIGFAEGGHYLKHMAIRCCRCGVQQEWGLLYVFVHEYAPEGWEVDTKAGQLGPRSRCCK